MIPIWTGGPAPAAPPACFLWFAAFWLVVVAGITVAVGVVFVLELVGVIPGMVSNGCNG